MIFPFKIYVYDGEVLLNFRRKFKGSYFFEYLQLSDSKKLSIVENIRQKYYIVKKFTYDK